jgi:hypothetical protein
MLMQSPVVSPKQRLPRPVTEFIFVAYEDFT